MTSVRDRLKEKLKDPHFRKLHALDEVKTNIAKKIVAYRIKNRLSQAELAKKLKVSCHRISNIEEGNFRNSFAAIRKILKTIITSDLQRYVMGRKKKDKKFASTTEIITLSESRPSSKVTQIPF